MSILATRPYRRQGTLNPLGFGYTGTTNAALYGQRSGMLITGRNNRYDAAFLAAKAAGCELLAYLAPMERPDAALGGLDDQFYLGDPTTVPLWPYTTNGNTAGVASGQNRINFAGNHMTDITVGSSWSGSVVSYISGLMTDQRLDGVFLDVIGSRLYSTGTTGANWGLIGGGTDFDWTQAEMDAWLKGCIDLVSRLDAARRTLNPNFIIVNNNVWNGFNASDSTQGTSAHPFVSGVCLEHHPAIVGGNPSSNAIYAGSTFSNLGRRRVLSIASTVQDTSDWTLVPGVTHISNACREVIPAGALYGSPTVPPIPFNPL